MIHRRGCGGPIACERTDHPAAAVRTPPAPGHGRHRPLTPVAPRDPVQPTTGCRPDAPAVHHRRRLHTAAQRSSRGYAEPSHPLTLTPKVNREQKDQPGSDSRSLHTSLLLLGRVAAVTYARILEPGNCNRAIRMRKNGRSRGRQVAHLWRAPALGRGARFDRSGTWCRWRPGTNTEGRHRAFGVSLPARRRQLFHEISGTEGPSIEAARTSTRDADRKSGPITARS